MPDSCRRQSIAKTGTASGILPVSATIGRLENAMVRGNPDQPPRYCHHAIRITSTAKDFAGWAPSPASIDCLVRRTAHTPDCPHMICIQRIHIAKMDQRHVRGSAHPDPFRASFWTTAPCVFAAGLPGCLQQKQCACPAPLPAIV